MKSTRLKPVSAKRSGQIAEENAIKWRLFCLTDRNCELCGIEKIADRGHEILFRSHAGSPVDPFNIILLGAVCRAIVHGLVRAIKAPEPQDLLAFIEPRRVKQGFKHAD
jgi:hypothetical protein